MSLVKTNSKPVIGIIRFQSIRPMVRVLNNDMKVLMLAENQVKPEKLTPPPISLFTFGGLPDYQNINICAEALCRFHFQGKILKGNDESEMWRFGIHAFGA